MQFHYILYHEGFS